MIDKCLTTHLPVVGLIGARVGCPLPVADARFFLKTCHSGCLAARRLRSQKAVSVRGQRSDIRYDLHEVPLVRH